MMNKFVMYGVAIFSTFASAEDLSPTLVADNCCILNPMVDFKGEFSSQLCVNQEGEDVQIHTLDAKDQTVKSWTCGKSVRYNFCENDEDCSEAFTYRNSGSGHASSRYTNDKFTVERVQLRNYEPH